LPTSSAHCSNSSRQNFTLFSGSLERLCSCRTQSKTRKSVDRVSSKRPKNAQNAKFQPPHMGADSPQTKTIFLKVTRAIRCKGQVGVRAPKGGKPPEFSTPNFFENSSSDFSQKLTQGKRLSEVCKFVLWSRSDDQILRKTSHSFGGLGQYPTRQPGIRPPVFLAPRRRRHRTARAATGHVAGQRGPFGRRHGGQKPYFRFDWAGSSILRNSLAE